MIKPETLKDHIDADHGDMVIKQEFITIKIVDGVIIREVVTRNFEWNGNYIDHKETEPIVNLEIIPKHMLN